MNKVRVGISSCLLGQKVRYDGGHTKNSCITGILDSYFEWVPFCPEVACGMGIPRPPIELRLINHKICCVGVENHNRNVTKHLNDCSENQNKWLKGLSGYILKSGSPSCGMQKVKVYDKEKYERIGTGLFAQHLKDNFPLLPLEEEGRLDNCEIRERFIQRVFCI